jgi:hypothetical protein
MSRLGNKLPNNRDCVINHILDDMMLVMFVDLFFKREVVCPRPTTLSMMTIFARCRAERRRDQVYDRLSNSGCAQKLR